MRYNEEYLTIMQESLEAFFDGLIKISDVDDFSEGVINRTAFVQELDRLTCHHPQCTENNPCRAALRRSGAKMACTALTNTYFGENDCPFFKTKEQFRDDFLRSYTAEKPVLTKNRQKYIELKYNKKLMKPVGKKAEEEGKEKQ